MLSILIPIYNFDVREFIRELSSQAQKLSIPVEIVCLDDASDESYRGLNASIAESPSVHYELSHNNLGRSAVRNRLVAMAQFDNLLFLDCDGKCQSNHYLEKYVEHLNGYEVIYGGRVYDEEAPDDHDYYFHWYCGSNREAILVQDRLLNPYKSFMTNNFLIKRSVYDTVKMDESLVGYGHEDTLFAIELKKAGYRIDHIENPIEHIGLEPFDVFIQKSENGVRNLAYLIKHNKVGKSIKLVKYYKFLSSIGMMGLVATLIEMDADRILKQLQGPAPNLLYFDFWKLAKLHRSIRG
ncbi:MAG: glycosyltransferase [Flavobacteriales bacterium]